jgi:hypothetical protein
MNFLPTYKDELRTAVDAIDLAKVAEAIEELSQRGEGDRSSKGTWLPDDCLDRMRWREVGRIGGT